MEFEQVLKGGEMSPMALMGEDRVLLAADNKGGEKGERGGGGRGTCVHVCVYTGGGIKP